MYMYIPENVCTIIEHEVISYTLCIMYRYMPEVRITPYIIRTLLTISAHR